jgi:transcriptional regulator with XRE-family HTH domain
MLADVGTTWYTWLEQGRDVRPSNEVLSALAGALRLDPTERRHLFVLHDRPAPEERPAGACSAGAGTCWRGTTRASSPA